MKKVFIILCILLVTILIVISRQIPSAPVIEPVISQTPTPVLITYIEVEDSRISYQIVKATPQQISAYSNLKNATDSASARKIHSCTSLINAGFYTKERTHLGQFISDGVQLSEPITSNLVDGYLTMSIIANISYEKPSEDVRISVQSGPVVWIDGKPRQLKLIQDEFARRMIVALQPDGTVLFITLFSQDHEFSGPLLKQVPEVLSKIAAKEKLSIQSALNLDGGSASAFLTSSVSLTEITPIGGYFCIK